MSDWNDEAPKRKEWESLPGRPRKKLVQDVRRCLWTYGIRPKAWNSVWVQTWEWAAAIGQRQSRFVKRWPLPSEIATQYVVLLLCHMREDAALKLPWQAGDFLPDHVRARLGAGMPMLGLPAPPEGLPAPAAEGAA